MQKRIAGIRFLEMRSYQVGVTIQTQCNNCPLGSQYAGRAGLSADLNHAGTNVGWLCLSCARGLVVVRA